MTVLLALALVFPSPVASAGDDPPLPGPDQVVEQKRGKTLEGRILFVDADRLVLKQKSRAQELERGAVQSYRWYDEALHQVLPELAAASRGEKTVAELHDLAQRCVDGALPGEARLAHWFALRRSATDQASHEALGHRGEGDGWRVKVGSRWIKDDKLDEHCSDWGDAHELSTAHFDVRSNLPLDQVLTIAVQAETCYDAFFTVFQDLGLYHPAERMGLHVHGDHASFPLGGEYTALYLAADRRTVIDASKGYEPAVLARRLTAQLLHASSMEMGDRSDVPAWLREGLARLFEATLGLDDPDAKQIAFDPARRHDRLRATYLRAEDRDDMGRILQLAGGDFYGDHRQLRYAEAYCLVEFLMYGDGGAHLEGFQAFVRGAMDGKGSSTHLKKAVGMKDDDLQDGLDAWAAR